MRSEIEKIRAPRSFTMGPHLFKVRQLPKSIKETYGMFIPMKQLIYVDYAQPDSVVRETLLHELVHAAWWVGCLEASEPEERVAGTIGSLLAQAIQSSSFLRQVVTLRLSNDHLPPSE